MYSKFLSPKRLFLLGFLLLSVCFVAIGQAVQDTIGIGNGIGDDPQWGAAIGYAYSGLVILFTALGTKFGFFSKISDKWIYSIAIGLVLGVVWITVGWGNVVDLLTQYFPIAGTIYQVLKKVGLLKLIGLEVPKTA